MDIIFVNPITKRIEQMPVAMIGAYVQHTEHLHLEEAARVAAIRDDEAAANLMFSVLDTEYPIFTLPEGASVDVLAVEPPNVR